MKPYYQDEWVTIYHLTSLPICDNLSLDKCMEVDVWGRKQLEGIGQGSEERMSPNYHLVLQGDTSKPMTIFKSVRGSVQNTTHIKARISLLNLVETELYVDIHSDLAKDVVIQNLRDTIRTVMRGIIVQRISGSYAEDVT